MCGKIRKKLGIHDTMNYTKIDIDIQNISLPVAKLKLHSARRRLEGEKFRTSGRIITSNYNYKQSFARRKILFRMIS